MKTGYRQSPGSNCPRRGAAWGVYGAAWAAAVPRSATRPVGLSPATNHATCFPPALRRLQGKQLQARPTGFSRITNHESRITAFFPITASMPCSLLPTIAHHCPPLPGIARQKILPGKCLHTVSRSRKALRRDHAAFRAPWAAATTK